MKNVVIIGSGPAGITAGIYLTRAGIENCIVTKKEGSLKKAHLIENYYGFEEPISGEELLKNGINQYLRLGGKIIEDEIVGITFEDKLVVEGLKEKYSADVMVIATGTSRLIPNIDGLKEVDKLSYCAVCDAFFYRGKKVAVLGDSNYAKKEAEILSKTSEEVIILSNGRETNIKTNIAINNKKIEKISQKENMVIINFDDYTSLSVDGLFIAEGIAGATGLAKKIGAAINGNNILVNEKMKTNIPGLYAIGDCVGGILQISKAIYDGTVAAFEIIKELKK